MQTACKDLSDVWIT